MADVVADALDLLAGLWLALLLVPGEDVLQAAGLWLVGFLTGGLSMWWKVRPDLHRLEHAESMTSTYLKSLDVDTHPTPDASQDRCPWPPPDPR